MWSSNQPVTLEALKDFDPHYYQGKGIEIRFLCPFCGNSKPKDLAHRSLCVNTIKGKYICQRLDCRVAGEFGKSRGHNPLSPERLAQIEAAAKAKKEHDLKVYKYNLKKIRPLPKSPGAKYLINERNINERVALQCSVKFAYNWYFRPSILFPLRDENHRLIGVNSRTIIPDEIPHRTVGDKLKGVFSTQKAFDSPAIFITEAPIDALSIYSTGYAAIASCGEGMPLWLVDKLKDKYVFIATDSDKAGDKSAQRWAQFLLKHEIASFRIKPDGYNDWNKLLVCEGISILSEQINQQMQENSIPIERSTALYGF